jgi:hypothetical protein
VGFFELIQGIFKEFLGLLLLIHHYRWCSIVEVSWEDCLGAIDHEERSVASCLARGCPQTPKHHGELRNPPSAELVELVEDSRLDALQNHVIRTLDLPIGAGVRHNSPIDVVVVVITESKEFFPMNCVLLSVMMEFRTLELWMIS